MSRGVDLDGTIKPFLLADAGVFALVGNRIFVDTWLPTTDQVQDAYQLSDGPALVLTPRGGAGSIDYRMASQTVITRCFGQSVAIVKAVDDAVFDAFKTTANPANNTAFYAKDTVAPDLRREEGGQYVMVGTYQVAQVI